MTEILVKIALSLLITLDAMNIFTLSIKSSKSERRCLFISVLTFLPLVFYNVEYISGFLNFSG